MMFLGRVSWIDELVGDVVVYWGDFNVIRDQIR
jgi:hypothetical protein